MFDRLDKYKEADHFFFNADDDLKVVCNAPHDKSGVYLIYTLCKGKIELVYIGRSGEVKASKMFVRKAGLGGLKDRLVNGHQHPYGKIPRKKLWPVLMVSEQIEALDIYWYVTHNDVYIDCPKTIENELLKSYFELYGRLPKWNNIL